MYIEKPTTFGMNVSHEIAEFVQASVEDLRAAKLIEVRELGDALQLLELGTGELLVMSSTSFTRLR